MTGLVLFGVIAVGTWASLRKRSHARRCRLVTREALAHPERRADAIAWLRRDIEARQLDVGLFGRVEAGARRRQAPLRAARLALAELLVVEEQPDEALDQLAHIALPPTEESPPIDAPAWVFPMRLIGCDAELQRFDAKAAATWLSPEQLEQCLGENRSRALDLAAQMALVRGDPEEALRILDLVPAAESAARPTLTRVRALSQLGRDAVAANLLRALPREALERVRRRYAREPVAAIADQLLAGPYR